MRRVFCMSLAGDRGLGGRHIFEVISADRLLGLFRSRSGVVFFDDPQFYVPWRPGIEVPGGRW